MKRGWPNFLGGTNSAERLNYLVPPSVFFSQIFGGPNSSSFISFHCILHVSVVFLFQFKKFGGPKLFFIHLIPLDSIWPSSIYLSFLKFPQIKEGGPNFFLGEPILQNDWIIWSPFLYLIFKNFEDSNSSSFNSFQWVLHDSFELFLVF